MLTVARLTSDSRHKGVDKSLEVMAELLRAGLNAQYSVVGKGDLLPELQAKAAHLGVHDRVRFMGAVSDQRLCEAYSDSDVFLLLSEREGFGMVFLEAMIHRLAVVTFASGAAPEVVDSSCGILLPLGATPQQISRLLLPILSDRPRLAMMGAAASLKARTRFSRWIFSSRAQTLILSSCL